MSDYRVPVLENFIWQESVIDKDLTSAPGSPTKGDRYICGTVVVASILIGGTPSGSSQYDSDSYSYAKACDGNEATRWATANATYPAYWQYDLGAGNERAAYSFKIKPLMGDGARVKAWTLSGSNDNSNWTQLTSGQHDNNDTTETYNFVNTTTYRYYKLIVTTSWQADLCSIWELYLYAPTISGWVTNSIMTYVGVAQWEETVPVEGMICWVADENLYYEYNGSTWSISKSGNNTGDETNARIAAIVTAATADTPLDADEWSFRDVVDSILKKITWANIKATLKTYFDALYGTKALDNLASVAINTSLISDTDVTDDLGSAAKQWRKVYTPAIAFPATQTADAGANVLDDYEEGTWTGAFTCGTSGTITIDTSTGSYTKIGRQVTVTGYFTVASVNLPVGTLTLTGLPFTIYNAASFYSAVVIQCTGLNATATTSMVGYGTVNTTTLVIQHFTAGVAAAAAADIKAASAILISFTYFI